MGKNKRGHKAVKTVGKWLKQQYKNSWKTHMRAPHRYACVEPSSNEYHSIMHV